MEWKRKAATGVGENENKVDVNAAHVLSNEAHLRTRRTVAVAALSVASMATTGAHAIAALVADKRLPADGRLCRRATLASLVYHLLAVSTAAHVTPATATMEAAIQRL
jgi:hypothetical protein